MLQTDCFLR